MEFVISQIFGIAASAAALLSMQTKNIRNVLILLLVCNGSGALSYILVGGFSGCGLYIAAVVQSVVYFVMRQNNKKTPSFLMWIFVAVFVCCSIATYRNAFDIISGLAALTCTFAIAQEQSSKYRLFMLANGLLWSVYDMSVGAYTMIVSHFITALSAIIGIIRLDLKKS